MESKTVKIGSSLFEQNSAFQLTAPSLGACIGVAIYDKNIRIGGMMVFMLPNSSIVEEDTNSQNPFLFADTGLPIFFDQAKKLGISIQRAKIVAAGGAGLLDSIGPYSVGKTNCQSVTDFLSKMSIDSQVTLDLGGSQNRTLKLDSNSGQISIEVWGQKAKRL